MGVMILKRPTVLIVDDEEAVCNFISDGLTAEGYICDAVLNADNALAKLKRQTFDVALLDIRLPGVSGMDLLKMRGRRYQVTAIIMITGVDDINTAVEAMKLGASDYIVKPFTLDKLNTSIDTVLNDSNPLCPVYDTLLVTEYIKNVGSHWFHEINALAYGVDAQVDYFDFHSKLVTERTAELARWLDLPSNEIDRWTVARSEFYTKRDMQIKSTLDKLKRNPMAQLMLGLTRLVY
jgi:DNA-binding response OmpR family regulator